MNNLKVIDYRNREIFISQGIGNLKWGSFRRKKNGALQRVKTKFLPMRLDKETAQRDLEIYARGKQWNIVA